MKIFVVEDDENIKKLIECALSTYGYEVTTFNDAESCLKELNVHKPNLILLDLMLPNMSGSELLKMMKNDENTKQIPIIILSAKSSEFDKVLNIENGADDYMTKPFSLLELSSRIKAVLRRVNLTTPQILNFKDLEIDLDQRILKKSEKVLELTRKEFDLIVYLLSNSSQIISKETLLNKIWGFDFVGETRTLDMHIMTLRQKLNDDASKPMYIKTIRGLGFTMVKD